MKGSDIWFQSGAADPHHFNADPNTAFHFYAALDPEPPFHFIADPDLILLLFKVLGIYDRWYIDPPLQCSSLSVQVSICERPGLHLWASTALHGTIFWASKSFWILTFMRIRIQLFILMRIRIRLTKIMQIHTYPDPQSCLRVPVFSKWVKTMP